jgi:Flp pilus assembly protein TadG
MIMAKTPFLTRLRNRLSGYSRDNSGVSAVEFALIAPVMIAIYFAATEISFVMIVDRKVSHTASVVGDLVAQDTDITNAEMNEILQAGRVIFEPYDGMAARIRVTSIRDNGGNPEVVWSDARNTTIRAPGSTVVVPAGVLPAGGSVIMTEVSFDYDSALGNFLDSAVTLEDTFYLRPRRANFVVRG